MTSSQQKRYQLYLRRLAHLQGDLTRLKTADQQFFWLRLITFFGGWLVTFAVSYFLPGRAWLYAVVVSITAFVVVVFYHRRLDRKRGAYQQVVSWFTTQLARLALDWKQIPLTSDEQIPDGHPFAGDLNLIGSQSLLHLLDTCTTRGGHARLLDWLFHPVLDAARIRNRQAVLQEMVDLPGFRNRLMILSMPESDQPATDWEDEKILAWLESGSSPSSLMPTLYILTGLAVVNFVLFFLFFFQVIPAFWQFSLILYAGIYLFRYQEYKSLFNDAYQLGKILTQFHTVLNFLETYPYPAKSKLGMVVTRLKTPDQSPSIILKKISVLISAASLQNNQVLTLLINLLLPWDLFFAAQLSRYKRSIRKLLPGWLDTWYEVEALHALANFGYLFPAYRFAEIIDQTSETDDTILTVQDMGHPLIPLETRVCNDFTLSSKGEVAIVTGSNMSGKSTFLRTVGINTVLALAGACVPAQQFRLKLVRLFTCIQVSDSLSEGFSYFYAEVHRLKQLLMALQQNDQPPALFLIDEIFRGTNNEERRIGSQAYVKALVAANGAGLISTHDLELSKLADEHGLILNYNFRDDVVEGRMSFDYQLRRGPSPTTNALKIMKLEGLPID